ncbi:maleylpyruvate isomerase family mycothiol-dependent enzyme [Actinocorallia populi]|uniref:maleylpyruvate isomerase family mycothiol-dependent enzyme n=1 Tax=Actinocorallia populi TaxID=2079200 RepID=UPI000D08D353|nr:maleylpyruvate isomerase family mycothiol-dependent enzyme [Actinocorallia populi]
MQPAFEENTAAFEQTVRAVIGLAEGFTDAEWELPTDCPGWTVKDMVSHLVSAEELFLGDPLPAHDLPDLPHVQNELGRMVEIGVDVRRPLPGAQVLEQLKAVLERRLAMLREVDPAAEAPQPDGKPGDYTRLMMFRAFDCWIHEQDIRRATGRPGGLDSLAGAATWKVLLPGLPFVVGRRAGAEPGESVAFEITGAREYSVGVVVDGNGRGVLGDVPAEPTTRITLDWEDYVKLAAGRCAPGEAKAVVEGDRELAGRILANMAVTP